MKKNRYTGCTCAGGNYYKITTNAKTLFADKKYKVSRHLAIVPVGKAGNFNQ